MLYFHHVCGHKTAYPEGNQRHLSAESGLYCRIFTEGLFGIRPTGLNSFTMTPRLPSSWNQMKLLHIRAFQKDLSIEVKRKNKRVRVTIKNDEAIVLDKVIKEGEEMRVNL
jgi:cellobiose phosphorylase